MWLDNFPGVSDSVWANLFGFDTSVVTEMRTAQENGYQFIRVY